MQRLHQNPSRSPRSFSLGYTSRFWDLDPRSVSPTMSLSKRTPDSTKSSSATTSCVSNQGTDTCQKPASMTAALPIALGVLVPVVAIIVLLFLHRRHKKKLRQEDSKDAEKYKSMDFGMDLSYQKGGKKGRKKPEMAHSFSRQRQMKGLSLDPGHSPFFLQHDLAKASTDSLLDNHQYRAVGLNSRSASPALRGRVDTDSTQNTMSPEANARMQRNAQSNQAPYSSKTGSSPQSVPYLHVNEKPLPHSGFDTMVQRPEPAVLQDGGLAAPQADLPRDSYFDNHVRDIRKSNNYLRDFIHVRENSTDDRLEKVSGSEPSSTVDSTASTMVDSQGGYSYKPAMDTYSDVESLPPMPISSQMSPTDPPTQPSAEHRVSTLPQQPKHESFEATLYNYHTNSMVSDNSNYTDVLRASRDSPATLQPVPSLPNGIPPRGQSLAAAMPVVEEDEPVYDEPHYLDQQYHEPQYHEHEPQYQEAEYHEPQHQQPEYHEPVYLSANEQGPDPNRLSVLMRPLPHDDPTEDPEQRANRIRSFYKEYFDDSKPLTSQVPMPQHSHAEYYEDYGSEYLNGGTVFDPQSGTFVMSAAPYAEPVTRRAMTPPPRAPPRFQAGPKPRSRAASNATSQYQMAPRGYSAMSHRGRAPGRRPMPPPQVLTSLPTPHLLKDDTAIFGAVEFAPPVSYRERQAGRRPDSPLGVQRPYSPAVRAHTPLVSSFEDLGAIPSPHMLRKSGTFTSLDFVPPPRFRNVDNASDAGSVRSGRSNVSAQQVHNIRAGAYRMSRLPGHLAGTKDDIMSGLKPTWDLRGPV